MTINLHLHFQVVYLPQVLLHCIDWETHQLYSENRGRFHSQWRATPSGSIYAGGLQRGGTLKSYLLGVSSFYRCSKTFLEYSRSCQQARPVCFLPSVISLLHFLCNYAFFALFFIKIYCYIVILSVGSVKIVVFYCCIAQSE